MKLVGRTIEKGIVNGTAVVSRKPISPLGGINPKTGIITQQDSDIKGECVTGKILVFPFGKGSTVGSYVLYQMKKEGTVPLAILNDECETIVATGAILSAIPCIDKIDTLKLKSGDVLEVNADLGEVNKE